MVRARARARWITVCEQLKSDSFCSADRNDDVTSGFCILKTQTPSLKRCAI